jgi:hypothetical protein
VNTDASAAGPRKTDDEIERKTIVDLLRMRADEKATVDARAASQSRSVSGEEVNCAERLGPSRADGAPRGGIYAKRLWSAVLKMAVDDLQQNSSADDDAPSIEDKDDALDWFLSDDTDPGSFLWICEQRGSRPKAILAKLDAALEAAEVDRLQREERAREKERLAANPRGSVKAPPECFALHMS